MKWSSRGVEIKFGNSIEDSSALSMVLHLFHLVKFRLKSLNGLYANISDKPPKSCNHKQN